MSLTLEMLQDTNLLIKFTSKYDIKDDDECWEWKASKNKKGYGCGCWINSLKKNIKAHRLSYMIHNNTLIDETTMILHSCDNPSCVNPKHLRPGTALENSQDARSRGRIALNKKRGIEHPQNKLTEQQVLEIREASGKQRDIAKQYNINRRLVWAIKHNVLWKHI